MNTELLATIRDWLLTPDLAPGGFDFDMEHWIVATPETAISCCIAGAALIFSDYPLVEETLSTITQGFAYDQPVDWSYRVENLAADALDIDPLTADRLFYAEPTSRHHAAQVLDHLIKTGEVQWTQH